MLSWCSWNYSLYRVTAIKQPLVMQRESWGGAWVADTLPPWTLLPCCCTPMHGAHARARTRALARARIGARARARARATRAWACTRTSCFCIKRSQKWMPSVALPCRKKALNFDAFPNIQIAYARFLTKI